MITTSDTTEQPPCTHGGYFFKYGGEIVYSPINRRKLGKTCQEKRKADGWTQALIALDIGCDIRAVSQFECGYSSSFRVLAWYIMNGYLDAETIRGCARYA